MYTETIVGPHSPEQTMAPKPGYLALEEEIAELDQRINALIDAVHGTCDDDVREKLDQLDQAYAEEEQHRRETDQPSIGIAGFLESFDTDGIPDDLMPSIVEVYSLAAQGEQLESQLEAHAPEKAAAIAHQARSLENKLDYDKIVTAAFAKESGNTAEEHTITISPLNLLRDVSELITMRGLLESEATPSYEESCSYEAAIQQQQERLDSMGLLRAEPLLQDEASHVSYSNEELRAMRTHIGLASNIRKQFKFHLDEVSKQEQQLLLELGYITNSQQGTDSDPGLVLNDQLREALSRHIKSGLDELPKDYILDTASEEYRVFVEHARAIDVANALLAMDINGSYEDLPYQHHELLVKMFLAIKMPPLVLASVRNIHLREVTADEDPDGTVGGWQTWSQELGGSEITVSPKRIRQLYSEYLEPGQADPDLQKAAETVAYRHFQGVLLHEFGHALHAALPIATLQEWKNAIADDPVHISPYVKHQHDSDHAHRYAEDFADSLKLFIQSPEQLALMSPARLAGMRHIFEVFMPNYAFTLKESQDKAIAEYQAFFAQQGISPEEARNQLLELNAQEEQPAAA